MRFLKFCIALLLLPTCAALTVSAWQLAQTLAFQPGALAGVPALAFCGGYGLWLVVFVALPKPLRTYVLGHELTHALWALLMGARVSGLKVRQSGGQVRTSKSNWAIVLAPYFFPFYAMLFIGLFFLVNIFWSLAAYRWGLFFLIGLGWSFHVTFTLMMLLTVSQPDVRSQGAIFSAVVIYLMNLLFILATAALLAHDVKVAVVAGQLGQNWLACHRWTLDKLIAIWHSLTPWLRPLHR